MFGQPGITAVYYLPGARSAIIDAASALCVDQVLSGLEEAGAGDLDWIVLTHIHLDHAGAAGHLARRFPRAKVVVRAEGAPHLVDPSRLWASAGRLYPDMEGTWGSILPIPEERITAVSSDGAVADLGNGRRLEALYAPGHANHQMALLDRSRGDLFTGDAIGVHLPDSGIFRPATPPPDFDLEVALETIEHLHAQAPRRIFPTHFGPVPDVATAFDEAAERITKAVEVAEKVVGSGGGAVELATALASLTAAEGPQLDATRADKLQKAISDELNALGMLRYLSKRPSHAPFPRSEGSS